MKHLSTFRKLLLMLCVMLGGANVWGETLSKSWDLTKESQDWKGSGNETYFKQPYGFKKLGGTLTNTLIEDFRVSGISQIKVGFQCLQNGALTSKLTIYLVDSNGEPIGNGVEVTPVNANAANKTTFQYATFTENIEDANGFMMEVTTFGKNILVNGAEYEVTYTPSADYVAPPTFSLAAGTPYGNQTLEITTTVENGTIYYTTDETVPTTSATRNTYSSALTISETTTIKACVKDSEGNYSDVVTRTYTIVPSIANTKETALTTAEAKALIDKTTAEQLAAEMVYVKGTISKVDSYNTTYKSITYWLDNDADAFEVYSGKNLNNTDFSGKTDIEVGAQVIVYGNIKKFNTTYEFDKNNYLVEYTAPAAKAIKSVEITGAASKTNYEKGEKFSRNGLTLTVTYEDETTLDVTSDATWTVTPETLNEIGITQVTVTATYKEYAPSKSIDVTVTAPQPAALPFNFDGGKSAISTTQGMDQRGLGDDYKSSPKLRFDDTNDELVIYYDGSASYLGYTIKGNNFSGGTFSVMESVDGVNYTNVASYTTLAGSNTACMNALKSASRYVKFVYTEKSTGNVALGAIEISADKAPVTVSAAGYATYYNSAKAYTLPAGCEGHVFYEGKLDKVYEAEAVVPANEPLVIKAEAGTYVLNFTTSTGESYKSAGLNDLDGTDEETALPADDTYNFYALSLNSAGELNSVGFYWMNGTGAAFTNGAHKAYLKLAKNNGAGIKAFVFGDEETAIKSVEAENASEAIYDLSGRRVSKALKGLYIINGKKVVK